MSLSISMSSNSSWGNPRCYKAKWIIWFHQHVLALPHGPLPVGHFRNTTPGGILIECPKHRKRFLSMWCSSSSTLSFLLMCELPSLLHKKKEKGKNMSCEARHGYSGSFVVLCAGLPRRNVCLFYFKYLPRVVIGWTHGWLCAAQWLNLYSDKKVDSPEVFSQYKRPIPEVTKSYEIYICMGRVM